MRRQGHRAVGCLPAEKGVGFRPAVSKVREPTPSPSDLRGRITDAFIDSLATDRWRLGAVPRKSGWVHQDEDLLRRSLAETNDMRQVLAGRISGSGETLTLALRL